MSNLALLGGKPVRTEPFTRWPVFDEREVQAAADVVRSGNWWRNAGEKVAEFEKAFATYHDVQFAIAVTNGTSALEIPLAAMGVGPGDEVVVTSYSFVASATAIAIIGATPVFVDIEPDTYNIDVECFEKAITEKTKAVVVVHFAGMPCNMDRIMDIAKRHNILVLEDAAHAHGGEYKGKKIGSFGHAAGFSFQASKNMTSGEGGIITSSIGELAEKMYSRHTFGRMPGGSWHEHYIIGTNARMTEIQAAMLMVQLSRLKSQSSERLKNASILDKGLQAFSDEISPMRPIDKDTERRSYHIYMMRYLQGGKLSGISRSAFIKAMRAEGIPMDNGYIMPLYKQKLFEKVPWGIKQTCRYDEMCLPNVEKAVTESLWIMQNALLGDSTQVEDILTAMGKVIKNADELKNYNTN